MEHKLNGAKDTAGTQACGPDPASQAKCLRTVDEHLLECMRACAHYLRHQTERRGSQRRALELLCARGDGGMTQRELIERMGIQPGSMSELLGKLEDQCYIARCKNPVDKRNVDLYLLDAGHDALQKMQEEYERTLARLFSALQQEEKAQLQALLKRLLDSWDAPCAGRYGHKGHPPDNRGA